MATQQVDAATKQRAGRPSLAHAAARVAGYARRLREEMLAAPLAVEMEALARLTGRRYTHDECAGLGAQLISYGLFAARAHSAPGRLPEMLNLLCRAMPDLEALLRPLRDTNARYLPVAQELADFLAGHAVATALAAHDVWTDPLIQGYEHFLAAYDPAQRGKHGIFYTPRPVASYIVRSLAVLLRREFGRPAGLASDGISLYDPCLGCGAFYREMLDNGGWNERWRGCELLPVPYLLAQLRLGLQLLAAGRVPARDTFGGLVLADALTGQGLPGLAEGMMPVIFGNPPYAGHSAQRGGWVEGLLRADDGYFSLDGQPLGERNAKWLHDDYVKFFRLAQWHVARAGAGVVAFITNHGFLANPTFRGMRASLLRDFDALYVLDLHGNTRKRTRDAEGVRDEGIFHIQSGVAISVLVKHANPRPAAPALHYAELWGTRPEKLAWLAAHDLADTPWRTCTPSAPFHLFLPRGEDRAAEYQRGWPIAAAMPVHSLGVLSKRDALVVDFSEEELLRKLDRFADPKTPDAVCAAEFGLPLRDQDGWELAHARAALAGNSAQAPLLPILYRPFDRRYLYDHALLVARRNLRVLRHLRQPNVALLLGRQGEATGGGAWNLVFASALPTDQNIFRRGGGTVFPLYLYDGEGAARRANFTPEFLDEVARRLGLPFVHDAEGESAHGFSAPDLLHYLYALLHAEGYRQRYADFLALDFPRVPLTSDVAFFRALAALGARLLRLQLGACRVSTSGRIARQVLRRLCGTFSTVSGTFSTVSGTYTRETVPCKLRRNRPLDVPSYLRDRLLAGAEDISAIPVPQAGEAEVRVVRYSPPAAHHAGRIWLHPGYSFAGIPPEAWAYHLGGYPVLRKWLQDRRGRRLSAEDVTHFRRIVSTILATLALTRDIDALIIAHGGWPVS